MSADWKRGLAKNGPETWTIKSCEFVAEIMYDTALYPDHWILCCQQLRIWSMPLAVDADADEAKKAAESVLQLRLKRIYEDASDALRLNQEER